jgi:hypothetical protein
MMITGTVSKWVEVLCVVVLQVSALGSKDQTVPAVNLHFFASGGSFLKKRENALARKLRLSNNGVQD